MNLADFAAQVFNQAFIAQVAGAIVLVVCDLSMGVVLAIRNKKFEFGKLGDFYLTTVVPYLLGWLVAYLAVKTVGFFALDAAAPFLSASLEAGAYGILVLTLGAQFFSKAKELWGRVPGQNA